MLDTSFHTLNTRGPEFTAMVQRGKGFFESFKEFAVLETLKAGKLRKSSNKAGSYYNFLVRLSIGIENNLGAYLSDFYEFKTYRVFEGFMKDQEMRHFNRETHNYYSAAVSCYLRFISQYQQVEEDLEDNQLNQQLVDYVEEESAVYVESRAPKQKAMPVERGNRLVYPRDIQVAYRAKVKANWQCEYDHDHQTFLTQVDRRPYMEAHHLIPMATQPYFPYSIDFVDNVVCLCPICHRRIHCACREEKADIVDRLFGLRRDYYAEYGITVDQGKLYGFYGIE